MSGFSPTNPVKLHIFGFSTHPLIDWCLTPTLTIIQLLVCRGMSTDS